MVQNDCLAIVADSQAAAGIQVPLELSWGEVTEQDWEAQVRASYVPLQLADDLWIIPEWCAKTADLIAILDVHILFGVEPA
jgi:ribosomal protein L11 methylase PrmA